MTNQHTTEDKPSTVVKQMMSQHFDLHEEYYRNSEWGTIIYEDSEIVLVTDHTGHEFKKWAYLSDMSRQNFIRFMNELVRQVPEWQTTVNYPLVFEKLE